MTAARADGFDLKAAQRAMLPLAGWLSANDDLAGEHYIQLMRASNTSAEAVLLRHPEIFDWLKFRCNSMTRMFARVHDTVTSIKPKMDVRLNAFIYDAWELRGNRLYGASPAPWLDSLQQLRRAGRAHGLHGAQAPVPVSGAGCGRR